MDHDDRLTDAWPDDEFDPAVHHEFDPADLDEEEARLFHSDNERAMQMFLRDRALRDARRRRDCVSRAHVRTVSLPRTRSRESHGRRPGHRRVRSSTRAGPDDGPGEPPEPALALAPPPKTIYHYAAEVCPSCGAVLLWSDGRLICCRRSCPLWGRPA